MGRILIAAVLLTVPFALIQLGESAKSCKGNVQRDGTCEIWKGRGYCSGSYANYMRKNCYKSCGYCGDVDPCANVVCNQNGANGEQCVEGVCNCGNAPCGNNEVCDKGNCESIFFDEVDTYNSCKNYKTMYGAKNQLTCQNLCETDMGCDAYGWSEGSDFCFSCKEENFLTKKTTSRLYRRPEGRGLLSDGACRTKTGDSQDVFSCSDVDGLKVMNKGTVSDWRGLLMQGDYYRQQCLLKCYRTEGCKAVSIFAGVKCCGLSGSDATRTTSETGWECFHRNY